MSTKYELFIDGKWTTEGNQEYFPAINPYKREEWASIPQASDAQVAAAIAAARRAFDTNWSKTSGLERARLLVVAIGDPMTARLAVERARAINPRLTVIARARGRAELGPMRALGVTRVADPEIEAALELTRAALARMGVSGPEQVAITLGIRRRVYGDLGGEVNRSSAEPQPSPSDSSTGDPGGGR